jgi:hypothetical protein
LQRFETPLESEVIKPAQIENMGRSIAQTARAEINARSTRRSIQNNARSMRPAQVLDTYGVRQAAQIGCACCRFPLLGEWSILTTFLASFTGNIPCILMTVKVY